MEKHILFILKPGFYDGEEGPYYCPHSAALEGIILFNPELEDLVDVKRIDFQRPRMDIVPLIGEKNQGSPVLVLAEGSDVPPEAAVYEETGRAYMHGEINIANYFSQEFGIMRPH